MDVKSSASAPAGRPGDDAVSLHSQPEHNYFDDDVPELHVDDLPPLYSDVAESTASSVPLLTPESQSQAGDFRVAAPAASQDDGAADSLVPLALKDTTSGAEYYLSRRLDTDPAFLEAHIRDCARRPPRPFVRVLGTHREHRNNGGKSEKKTVVDFDVKVELTPYLYSDAATRTAWTELRTVETHEKVRRGTVLRKTGDALGPDGHGPHGGGVEAGEAGRPTLAEWCHRYCASHAGLKCFRLERRVVGLDEEKVRRELHALVEATMYKGAVAITFPTRDALVDVYNEARTNRWRLTAWAQWLAMLTLLFIFTWPYLLLRTKRWEVVVAEWHFSRPPRTAGPGQRREYVSLSEDQWYNLWARAIHRAVIDKRAATLDQRDLRAAEGAAPSFASANFQAGSALGFVQAGLHAMGEVNRQFGWGADTY